MVNIKLFQVFLIIASIFSRILLGMQPDEFVF